MRSQWLWSARAWKNWRHDWQRNFGSWNFLFTAWKWWSPPKYIYILIIINTKYAYRNTSAGRINVKEKKHRICQQSATLSVHGCSVSTWVLTWILRRDTHVVEMKLPHDFCRTEEQQTYQTQTFQRYGGGMGKYGRGADSKIQFGNCCIGFSMATIMFCLHLHALLQNVRTEIFNSIIHIYI